MKIAIWGPTPFAGRKSSHLLLLALQAVALEEGEQLILHPDPSGSGPEHFLLSGSQRSRMMEQKEFGVEYLSRVLLCERFSKEAARNAAYTFAGGKLHVLPAGGDAFYQEEQAVAEVICGMMRQAAELFQNVWIELPGGVSELAARVMEEADCVLVNITRSPWEIEKMKVLPRFKHVFYLIGACERRSIYAIHNLALLYPELRGRCAEIPYYAAFGEACLGGEAERFLMRKTGGKEFSEFSCAVKQAYLKWKGESGG